MKNTIKADRQRGFAGMPGSGLFATWEVDPVGAILGTGYMRFTTSFGLAGLAKATGDRLDVLAVDAARPGTGQFRRFIDAAKQSFSTVAVWEDWNPILAPALERYGFHPATHAEDDGEILTGWEWHRPNNPLTGK